MANPSAIQGGFTKIRGNDGFIPLDLIWRTSRNLAAEIKNHDVIRRVHDQCHIVFNEQYSGATFCNAPDELRQR
jgi:hypothetical protein